MAVNPKKACKFTIGTNRGIVRLDADQIPLGAQTGFTLATDEENGIPTSISDLAAQSLAVRVGVRYTSGTRIKTGYIWMTVEEIGKGSIAKLEGKPFKSGTIRSAKVPQRSVTY